MDKKKVLFILLQLDAGGSERVALDLARNLDKKRFEVYLAAFKGGVLEPAFRDVCRDVFFIDKKTGFDLGAMLLISRIIARHRIDVVNAHHYMPFFYSFFGARVLHNRKLIYTEHSVPEVEDIRSRLHGALLNVMLYRLSVVVGVSQQITDTFKRSYPGHAKKFVPILNGVDVEKFYQPQFRESVRQQFGFGHEHFVVGTVANFRKIKNHVCIVRAAARLKDSCPQLRFLFVGTGFPDDPAYPEDHVRRLVEECGLQDRVIFAGYQANIPAMLAAMDAFCLASFSEGLPVSILEAMAARLPVIGSRVRGIAEVVVDGDNGLMFTSGDDQSLATCIERVINNSEEVRRYSEVAFDMVNTGHGLNLWVDCYANLFV